MRFNCTLCCALNSNRMFQGGSVMARRAALYASLAERFLADAFGG